MIKWSFGTKCMYMKKIGKPKASCRMCNSQIRRSKFRKREEAKKIIANI